MPLFPGLQQPKEKRPSNCPQAKLTMVLIQKVQDICSSQKWSIESVGCKLSFLPEIFSNRKADKALREEECHKGVPNFFCMRCFKNSERLKTHPSLLQP
ncbi:hypothetical protein PoB_005429500 [Plakobranchus ocellatus]|uniref:Uncharacterized protein n=1 Tax=Plakobranchus ocellatus TaxID=259542 RepID=A0AAV4C523_9GAST|nr:hypothetical protein PoB_005429500 [Plakobranchus ocellatus]